MMAYNTAKMCLYIRSVMWDLDVPQEAATLIYEDNDACTAMANAQKPTSRTRNIDIKYFSLCDWVEMDLMKLERVDTSINLADNLTKPLGRVLFHRHSDFILGHVPPSYSPVYKQAIGTYNDSTTHTMIPESFTTPTLAAAARVRAPISDSIQNNPWRLVLVG